MTMLGAAHFAAAVAALAFGAVVLLERKGTNIHRVIGIAYVAALVVANVTALGVYQLTGQFGPFHMLALISLAILARGVVAMLRRPPGWLLTHYYSMAWSYIGLLAAASAEVVSRAPLGLVRNGCDGMTAGLLIAAAFTVIGFIVLPRLRARMLAYQADA